MQYCEVSTRVDCEDQFNMSKKRVVSGPLIVTRNPCLHPGDVRQLEAVDVRELSHLVDCVVFPRYGSRPQCNEMAGRVCHSKVVARVWGWGCFLKRTEVLPSLTLPLNISSRFDSVFEASHQKCLLLVITDRLLPQASIVLFLPRFILDLFAC